MVDSGATKSFIDEAFVSARKLTTHPLAHRTRIVMADFRAEVPLAVESKGTTCFGVAKALRTVGDIKVLRRNGCQREGCVVRML